MSRSSIQTSRCRICSSQIIPWVDSWLGFRWGKCVECGSVQKLISKDQFEALGASYDPGYLASGEPSPELLRQNMGVDKKYRLLRRLIGAGVSSNAVELAAPKRRIRAVVRPRSWGLCSSHSSQQHPSFPGSSRGSLRPGKRPTA